MKKGIKRLGIGHQNADESYFKIVNNVTSTSNVEVTFTHRHSFYGIYWIHKGEGQHIIDFEPYVIKANQIFFMRPDQMHEFNPSPNIQYSSLQFTEEFILPFHDNVSSFIINACLDITQEEAKRLKILFDFLSEEARSCRIYSSKVLQAGTTLLLVELMRINTKVANYHQIPDVLMHFKSLIEQRYTDCHQVADYARILSITPNYLNIISRKYLGKSALELIKERIILEIKRRLYDGQQNISEIAYDLKFDELSYFTKFFKNSTGLTPSKFRNVCHQ